MFAVFSAGLLSTISLHYLEETLFPLVAVARNAIYGSDPNLAAASSCELDNEETTWRHPTSLALTVYGDTQKVLEADFGPHGAIEVLPAYAAVKRGQRELRCVADYFLAVSARDEIAGQQVRSYPFHNNYEKYNLESGWVSGLTQGLVGQVLLAAYLDSNDEAYLFAAREAGNLLSVDIEDGGVQVRISPDAVWFEEYAQAGAEPALVLNGHLLALDYLYWMRQVDKGSEWDALFEEGMNALVELAPDFRGAVWSYYDKQSNLANRKYHSFHVRQLGRYSQHDESGLLAVVRHKMAWQLYVPLGIFQRLLTQPTRMLLFLGGVLFALYLPATWILGRCFMRKRNTRDCFARN
jgi:hypothetical protein